MSHFSLLVPADNKDHLKEVLQPYHEYECTGIDDKYVVWVDETEEVLNEYETHINRFYKLNDGSYVGIYDEEHSRFDRESDDVYEMSNADAGISLDEFLKYWYGRAYGEIPNSPGRYGHKTNPNAKWDWWCIGGRWSGSILKLKSINPFVECPHCAVQQTPDVKPGEIYRCSSCGAPLDVRNYCNAEKMERLLSGGFISKNSAPVWMIDFDSMRSEEERMHRDEYREYHEIIEAYSHHDVNALDDKQLAELLDEYEKRLDAKNDSFKKLYPTLSDYYRKSIACRSEMSNSKGGLWFFGFSELLLLETLTEDEYVHLTESPPTFAFIDTDGSWVERATMGWFGCAYGENLVEYNEKFNRFINSVDPDQILYIVDCHI